jgi:phage-related protein
MQMGGIKPLEWIGSSKRDLCRLSEELKNKFGYALFEAQLGTISKSTKPLKGFGGAGVLEVVESDDGGTYRAVYTVKFSGVVYVLHVFQKKSAQGISTQKYIIDLIKDRLRMAQAHYKEHKHEYQKQD